MIRVEKLTKGSMAKCKYKKSEFSVSDLHLVLEMGVTKTYYALVVMGSLLGTAYDVLPAIPFLFTTGEGVEWSPDVIPSSLSTISQEACRRSKRDLN